MVNKHMKRCSTFLVIREMGITKKSKANKQKAKIDKCWRKYEEIGCLYTFGTNVK